MSLEKEDAWLLLLQQDQAMHLCVSVQQTAWHMRLRQSNMHVPTRQHLVFCAAHCNADLHVSFKFCPKSKCVKDRKTEKATS